MRRWMAAAAAVLTLATATAAAAQEATRQPEVYGFAVPQRWEEVDRSRQQNVDMITFVPQGQSLQGWKDMIILQVYREMTALPAESLRERTVSALRAACDEASAGALQTGLSNNYPSAFWITACTRNSQSGQGEIAYFRSLQGNDNLYLVQRVWNTPPFDSSAPAVSDAEKQEAIAILRALTVCQPGDARHPCTQ
ncbi:hypothetical protein [Caenispirillum bisanense]|uniref:hypothetical protein n=1 Tax=Caenispirillum bisanense TaxID=414052 RepID=UPI0031DC8B21